VVVTGAKPELDIWRQFVAFDDDTIHDVVLMGATVVATDLLSLFPT